MNTPRRRLLFLACMGVGMVALTPEVSLAQTPYQCSPSVFTRTPYQLKIGVDTGSDYPLDPLVGGLAHRRYDNTQRHTRKFVANRWVNQVSFSFTSIDLESGYDRFKIQDVCGSGGCSINHDLTGTPPLTNRDVDLSPWGRSLQSDPVRLEFTADSSITRKGVAIDSVLVRCSSGVYNDMTHTLTPGDTVDGVLLGSDDIVYMALPGGSTPGFHQTLAMWAPGADADFDVLVRCGAPPTAGLYDFASRTTSNQEFIHFSDANRTCSSQWYVGVHAYPSSGKTNRGFFRMLYSRHRATEHLVYKAAIRPYSCPDSGIFVTDVYRQLAADWLKRSAAEIFGATDGQTFIDFELYTLYDASVTNAWDPSWSCGGTACNVRMMPCTFPSGGQAYGSSDTLWVGWNFWNQGANSPGWILHEFGHAHYGLGTYVPGNGDGYWSISDSRTQLPSNFPTADRNLLYNSCGHSTMSNGYVETTAHKYCTGYNHARNPRYVKQGWETNILTDNGKYSAEAGSSANAYVWPISVTGYAQSYTPAEHSSVWSDRSDFRIAIDNGKLWMEPTGTDDPYPFLDFSHPEFPGRVTIK